MSNEHLELLLETLSNVDNLLILPHNDPDPDAITSAVALRYLLEQKLGIEGHIAYKGLIGRAENRALVRYLNHPLRPLAEADLSRRTGVALIDTQPGTGNNPWPPASHVTIVIDHHPRRRATASAGFADVRPEVGAASTILTEYLQAADIELSSSLATALFYGIKSDTRGLSRNASSADTAAYAYLQPRVDVKALAEIERAQVPAAYFKSFATTLEATRVYDQTAISYIGLMEYPDMAAEMADLLLRLEKIEWVICMGTYQGVLFLSVRTPGLEQNAGQLVQAIVQDDGTAGGHGSMAGGQILLKGKNSEHVVSQLGQRILGYLGVEPDTTGRTLT